MGRNPRFQNPLWSFDELVLLVELYQKVRRASPRHPEVIALSEFLNLAVPIDGERSSTFRNPIGVSMQLWNLGRLDPHFKTEPKAGRRNASKLSIQVWHQFANDPIGLEREAGRIRALWEKSRALPTVSISRGPQPAFGTFETSRTDGAAVLYIVQLTGALEALLPHHMIIPGWGVVKIGRSNDLVRRLNELSMGFPPGADLSWFRLYSAEYAGSHAAHSAEQNLLRQVEAKGWALGGEFALAPLEELKSMVLSGSRHQ